MYTIFDSYTYSRPVSYRSYYGRVQKPFVLNEVDPETEHVKGMLNHYKTPFDTDGVLVSNLARGIKFGDYTIGKRPFSHNSKETEYYVHQWKPTNDLTKEHPTGTHKVYHTFEPFCKAVERILSTPPAQL